MAGPIPKPPPPPAPRKFDDADLLETFSLEALEAAVATKREEAVDAAVAALNTLSKTDASQAVKECKHDLRITQTRAAERPPAQAPDRVGPAEGITPPRNGRPAGRNTKRSGRGPGGMTS